VQELIGSSLHRFDRDSAIVPAETGDSDPRGMAGVQTRVFDAEIDEGWWIVAGPNGGYLATILLRSMMETVGDPARTPRTQATHYTARPEKGPARVVTRIERSGRSLSHVTARLEQDGRLIALSVGALATARGGDPPAFQDVRIPEVSPPDATPARVEEDGAAFPFRKRYEMRPVFDRAAPEPDAAAETGGWIRPAGARPPDALLLTALADAWPPAVFQKLGRGGAGRGVPTVDLTVHFRAPEALARLAPDAWYLVRFATRVIRDGFIEEDGEIWSEDGVLLAQSRQLALMV
jgi:acyl-CoA thioesterase